jgi:hypothetical protein
MLRGMKLVFPCLVALAATSTLARADDDPGMQLMTVMMRCPAISADGKHVAIYSENPGSEKDAMTSLAVFGATGTVEQRISVVPPVKDVARAKAGAAKIVKLLDDGKYKRMSRVAQISESTKKTSFTMQVSSEDVVLDLHLENRKLAITGKRGGVALASISVGLGPKDGACKSVEAYSLANTMAGYDAKTGQFAFSIQAEHDKEICFAHDFVITFK